MKVIPILLFMILNISQMLCNNIDSLSKNVNHTTILEIKDADKIFKQKEEDPWDKYSPALIAIVSIIITSVISFRLANKQTKSALEQVKANNISAARIDWIQKLRPLLAELISKTSVTKSDLKKLKELVEIKKHSDIDLKEIQKLWDNLQNQATEIEHFWNQILLFLNKKENEHMELIMAYEKHFKNLSKKPEEIKSEDLVSEEEIIDKSKAILKTAWEQAKNIN